MDRERGDAGVTSVEIRVRGRVQGVGFRPHVYRLATELGLAGEVLNDAEGVLVRVTGRGDVLAIFADRITRDQPVLARVETVEQSPSARHFEADFRIIETDRVGAAQTEIAPDAVVCHACAVEIVDPTERRFRYPFTTCTHCGPRLTIVTAIPYDRAQTTMAPFPLCTECGVEYRTIEDRRFHAEATACPQCGPRVRLLRFDGPAPAFEGDPIAATAHLIATGSIVAIKGLGGYHLACDATRADVVATLRTRKKRDFKPFALMARDLDVVLRHAAVDAEEARALSGPEGPIVLLRQRGEPLPDAIAPGFRTLGFMLPTTPLHVLLLRNLNTPIVMTSGNRSGLPPITDDDEARSTLSTIADFLLVHDRAIANRVDDSVSRVIGGKERVFRRSRGHAPAPLRLPAGFEKAPPLTAFGGDLKATFCLVRDGQAVVSQHLGDLEDKATFDDYRKNLDLYAALFEHRPVALAIDGHPDYASSRLGRSRALAASLPIVEVQHHHAHAAACLAENGRDLAAPPVLAIVLDGLGVGRDGDLWGGEFLLADYRRSDRLGRLEPVALLGGDMAAREPWRNLYAHLLSTMSWAELTARFGDLAVVRRLGEKPRAVLDRMLATGAHAPRASSCGRLFDAVAAAVDITFERQAFEGQAGALLEAAVDDAALRYEGEDEALAYPFAMVPGALTELGAAPMWRALLTDRRAGTSVGVIAARFHRGLARALATMAVSLRAAARFDVVALSGGCFQNRVLFEQTTQRLAAAGFDVLTPARFPPNDGGLSLGQAVIAAARLLARDSAREAPMMEIMTRKEAR